MDEKLKFVLGEPEEGTLTLGVVFHVLHTKDIIEATGFVPLGYVIEVEEEDDDEGS